MARKFNLPEQDYAVGTYTNSLDSFTPNTNEIVVMLTRVAWPGVPEENVVRVSVAWADGSGAAWELPGGIVLDRDGSTLTAHTLIVTVPRTGQGRKNQASGVITFEVRQALRTAITAEGR